VEDGGPRLGDRGDRFATVLRWAVIALAVSEAGWMLFDGIRALVLGDYVTVDGELGPWAELVDAVGIDPRSTAMKAVFVAYGSAWLAVTAAFVVRRRWAPRGMAVAAAASLWYLVIGTISSAFQLLLLGALARRGYPRGRGTG
jgi:hypothetical protein